MKMSEENEEEKELTIEDLEGPEGNKEEKILRKLHGGDLTESRDSGLDGSVVGCSCSKEESPVKLVKLKEELNFKDVMIKALQESNQNLRMRLAVAENRISDLRLACEKHCSCCKKSSFKEQTSATQEERKWERWGEGDSFNRKEFAEESHETVWEGNGTSEIQNDWSSRRKVNCTPQARLRTKIGEWKQKGLGLYDDKKIPRYLIKNQGTQTPDEVDMEEWRMRREEKQLLLLENTPPIIMGSAPRQQYTMYGEEKISVTSTAFPTNTFMKRELHQESSKNRLTERWHRRVEDDLNRRLKNEGRERESNGTSIELNASDEDKHSDYLKGPKYSKNDNLRDFRPWSTSVPVRGNRPVGSWPQKGRQKWYMNDVYNSSSPPRLDPEMPSSMFFQSEEITPSYKNFSRLHTCLNEAEDLAQTLSDGLTKIPMYRP